MSLIVYSDDFVNHYDISHSISVQMSKYYNDVGKFTLVVPINDYNIEAIKNDRILYDTKKKIAYIVKNVKIDTKQNWITANGYTTNHILNSRVFPILYHVMNNVESDVYYSVTNTLQSEGGARNIPRLSVAPAKGLTESGYAEFGRAPVLESIMPVLSDAEMGHDMKWNHRTKEHIFEIYKGADLTTGIHAVVFSDEWGTARDLVINDDVSTFKNVAYVRAKYGDDYRNLCVGTATGGDRYEAFFDISLSQEENETEDQFRKRMETHGAMELGKLVRRQSFSVTIDPAELGVLYNIGDLVSCVSKRFGVRFNARITGMMYKKDANSETTEVVLGEPKLTAIGEVKLSG